MSELNSFFITKRAYWTIDKINAVFPEYFAQIADREPYDIQVRRASKGKYINLTKHERTRIAGFISGLHGGN